MKIEKIILIIGLAFGMAGISKAQYCNSFAMSKGMVLGYKNLDSKGQVTVISKTTCYDIIDSAGVITYKVKTELSDANNAFMSSREYEMKCHDSELEIDVESYADQNALNKFQNMAIDIDTEDMSYPNSLAVDQNLPDAEIKIETLSRFNNEYDYKFIITNRKVISKESVTVPAGTFDCYKVSYDMKLRSPIRKKFQVFEYISEGVGKVKTETYTKKGKISSSSLLVELKK